MNSIRHPSAHILDQILDHLNFYRILLELWLRIIGENDGCFHTRQCNSVGNDSQLVGGAGSDNDGDLVQLIF
jgi:hypothetical protein